MFAYDNEYDMDFVNYVLRYIGFSAESKNGTLTEINNLINKENGISAEFK